MRTNSTHRRLTHLYDTHCERVYRFCLRLCGGCQEDAEDLTQEVFLAALESLPRFAGRSTHQTWLFRIAVFRSRNLRQRRERLSTVPLTDLPLVGGESQILARLTLASALVCLSEAQREAFLLVKAEGLTHREAAKVLQLPIGTVQSQVYEAVGKLRTILSEEAFHG